MLLLTKFCYVAKLNALFFSCNGMGLWVGGVSPNVSRCLILEGDRVKQRKILLWNKRIPLSISALAVQLRQATYHFVGQGRYSWTHVFQNLSSWEDMGTLNLSEVIPYVVLKKPYKKRLLGVIGSGSRGYTDARVSDVNLPLVMLS